MLVLTRRRDEKIHISEDVVITVIEIRPYVVRLGIEAPREVPVHREEVWINLQAQQEQRRDEDGPGPPAGPSDPPPPETE